MSVATDCLHLTHNGKTMTVREWSIEIGVNSATINSRLSLGWTIHETLTLPVKGKLPSHRAASSPLVGMMAITYRCPANAGLMTPSNCEALFKSHQEYAACATCQASSIESLHYESHGSVDTAHINHGRKRLALGVGP